MYHKLFNQHLIPEHLGNFQYFTTTNAINNFVTMHFVLWEAYLQGKFPEVGLLGRRTDIHCFVTYEDKDIFVRFAYCFILIF